MTIGKATLGGYHMRLCRCQVESTLDPTAFLPIVLRNGLQHMRSSARLRQRLTRLEIAMMSFNVCTVHVLYGDHPVVSVICQLGESNYIGSRLIPCVCVCLALQLQTICRDDELKTQRCFLFLFLHK